MEDFLVVSVFEKFILDKKGLNMENSAGRTLLLHEKLSSSDTFLLLLGIILYTDAFLSIGFGVSLYSIDGAWYKSELVIGDFVTYVLLFSFLYGAAVPFLLSLIDMYLVPKISAQNSVLSGRVSLEKIMRDAIVEGNTAAYKHYENVAKKLESLESRRKSCLSIFILILAIVISFFITSSEGNIFQAFWGRMSGDGLIPVLVRLSLIFLSIWFLGTVLSTTDHYSNNESISGYAGRLESKWVREVTSGLIDKNELFSHLNITLASHDLMNYRNSYELNNSSHKFCKEHKLITAKEGVIKLTDKGLFFAQYKTQKEEKSIKKA